MTTGGRAYSVSEERCPLDSRHGRVNLGRIRGIDPENLVYAGCDAGLAAFDPRTTVFFDLETTGLSGGSGAFAFLVGTAHIEGNELVLRQYFLEDPGAEADMLQEVYDYFREFSGMVTYNGKNFDLPILRNRILHRGVADGLEASYHLDLLYTARRYWRGWLPSCRLKEVETGILGFERRGDVEGWEIPPLYFEYLNTGSLEILDPVMLHNRLDVKSLVALTVRANDFIGESIGGGCSRPGDSYKVGLVMEYLDRPDEAVVQLEAAAPRLEGGHRYLALKRLSLILKKRRRWPEAVKIWHDMTGEYAGDPFAYIELAKFYEHRMKDPARALELAAEALANTASPAYAGGEPGRISVIAGIEERLRRLKRKVSAS